LKTKMIFILAIVMGLVTTVLFYKYMSQFDTETTAIVNMTEVVAAKQAIKKNQRIGTEMLEKVKVPEQAVHPAAIRDLSEAAGKIAAADIAAGEQMLTHRIVSDKEESVFVSRKVKEGSRAVSVGVNFVRTVSNLIEPEDIVDIIFSEENKETKQIRTELLLDQVRVLAVGRRMIDLESGGGVYAEYSSVTLELTSQESVKLVNAYERGNLHFTIHSRVKE
jgi:pilus assembly protein CpaB